MTTLEAIRDFTEFYLLPYQPLKTVELVQYKIHRKIKGVEEPLFLTVSAFKAALSLLKKFRKSSIFIKRTDAQDSHDFRLYSELTHLSPEDCLIMIAGDRYGIADSVLALVIQKTEPSVAFRREQILRYLASENVPMKNPKELSLRDLVDSSLSILPIQRSLFQRFQALPFAIRFSLETAFVLSTLVLLMWIIPEIRNTYENSVQKRINDYLIESSLIDSPAPAGTSKSPKAVTPAPEAKEEESDASEIEASNVTRKQPKVNEGETWRFSFTGSQTPEIESGVQEALKKLGVESNKPLTVPGGIQFDFLVPTHLLIPIKEAFESMTIELQKKTGSSKQGGIGNSSANLSWYKKRNMGTRKIPSAHVQVIVWISTL